MSEYNNFAEDIEAAAGDEVIEAIVISKGNLYKDDPDRKQASDLAGRILTWEEARPALDYSYYTGYGGSDCHGIWAWTATEVLFVGVYDGSTWIESVPRNPVVGDPNLVGGE